MRKILLVLAAVVGLAVNSSAQNTEITIGYGGYTQMDATDCHDNWHHVNNAWAL